MGGLVVESGAIACSLAGIGVSVVVVCHTFSSPSPDRCLVAVPLNAGWPSAVPTVVGVMDLVGVVTFGGSRGGLVVGLRFGGGSGVGLGRMTRLGCRRATMAVRASWLQVVGGPGMRRRGRTTGVHHLPSPCSGR